MAKSDQEFTPTEERLTPNSKGGFSVRNQSGFSTLYRLADVTLIVTAWYACHKFFDFPLKLDALVLLVTFCIGFQISSEALDLYRSWRGSKTTKMVRYVAYCWAGTCLFTLTCGYFFTNNATHSAIAVLSWFIISFLALSVWRFVMRAFLFKLRKTGFNSRKAIVVGATKTGHDMARQIVENDELGIKFLGIFDDRNPERIPENVREKICGKIQQAIDMAKRSEVDYIYIALPMSAENRIREILHYCSDTTANVYLIPNFFVYNLMNSRWQSVGSIQALSVYDTPFQGASEALKRLEDIVFSSLILLMISIPMSIIALAVKLTSPGPVIFKQKRYGLDGKKISIYKFRSMTTQDNGPVVKQATKNDPRITKLGAFLRKTSLDELPQFINVLQGRMSIVGPRPHAVAHNEEYRKIIRGYMLRHKVRPGITGWAQVNGFRGETDTVEKMQKRVEYDLEYIHNWSILLDIKIIIKTAVGSLFDKNAY
ncbi:undecaprenyl-phosphate glucose phosphotransferase [Alteromonas gracilis]|uniref:undecaprenyl-phosphate glucose phosphotransferase n=1 Tax=Alteromonas gracilis TaxID=1479524 RepID=UPI0036F2E0AD